jgi:hypothetical protein
LPASKIATIYKNRWMIDYSNTVAFNELCGAIGVHKDTYKAWRKTHNASFDFST